MAYLILQDYYRQIQSSLLSQLTSGKDEVRLAAEQSALAEARSYLVQKYDMDSELHDTAAHNEANTYKAGARVYVLTNDVATYYYAKLPKPAFDLYATYNVGDEVFYQDKTYRCKRATIYPNHEAALQYGNYQSLPAYYNYQPTDTRQWEDLGAYEVPAATAINNTTYWVQGDSRNQQLLMYIIDMALFHLHSRITPNNIPNLRAERYESAIEWLRMAASGEVTAQLPEVQPRSGGRIRFGGEIKNINSY